MASYKPSQDLDDSETPSSSLSSLTTEFESLTLSPANDSSDTASVKKDTKDEWVEVSCLAGKAKLKKGKFVVPEDYYNDYKEKTYYAKSDCEFLELDDKDRLTIETSLLSRDVCSLSEDPKKVTFSSGKGTAILPGIWFHISTIGIAQKAAAYYREKLRPRDNRVKKIATSEVFLDAYSRTYLFSEKPKVRYHQDINSLIESYKAMLAIPDVEFRIYGTTRYSMEMMHTVLICPQNSCELNKFPVMEIGKSYDVIEIQRENGMYILKWRPYCTRDVFNGIWDHVTFLFYIPKDSQNESLVLSCPYKYQKATGEDRKFGSMQDVE